MNVAAVLGRGDGVNVRVHVKNYQMQLIFFVAVPYHQQLLRTTVPSFVINSFAASPVNGLDESNTANSHKSVLGSSVVCQHSVCDHS